MTSIIVPCYNGEKFLGRLFDCMERQTCKEFEVIIVNDGSKDNSADVAQLKASECSFPCKVINMPNGGVSRARNIGLDYSSGDYIMFVDVDDLMTDDRVEFHEHTFKTVDCDVVISETMIEEDYQINANPTLPIPQSYDTQSIYEKQQILDAFLAETVHTGVWGGSIRRSLINDNNLRFVEGCKYSEDLHFMWRVFACSRKVCVTHRITYIYMWVPGSAMSKFSTDRFRGYEEMVRLGDFMREHAPEFAQSFKKWGPQRILWSIMRQGSCLLSYGEWRQFLAAYPVRKEMHNLTSYSNRLVAMIATTYVVCPWLFYMVCRYEGKKRIHK